MKFCPNCGHPIDENAVFCPNCGNRCKNKVIIPVNDNIFEEEQKATVVETKPENVVSHDTIEQIRPQKVSYPFKVQLTFLILTLIITFALAGCLSGLFFGQGGFNGPQEVRDIFSLVMLSYGLVIHEIILFIISLLVMNFAKSRNAGLIIVGIFNLLGVFPINGIIYLCITNNQLALNKKRREYIAASKANI